MVIGEACYKLKNSYNDSMPEYIVSLFWDDEASVWIAESQDLPGLILESDSFDTLVERVKKAVPELLELGGAEHTQVKLHFKAECLAVVA
jgi:predicted RNase H-like HicB family nuclease